MQAGRVQFLQFLHSLYTVQLLNGSDSHTTEYPFSLCVTESESVVFRREFTWSYWGVKRLDLTNTSSWAATGGIFQ